MRWLLPWILVALVASSAVAYNSENESTKGVPLIEVAADAPEKRFFAVLISGDGGWAKIDRRIANTFKENGVPVVGLNSLKYFWKRKTPEQISQDLERILRRYFSSWGKQSVVLIGYSRGADVLPFMINHLPKEYLEKIEVIALLGLETSVELEIHASDIFNKPSKNPLPIRPEMEKLKGQNILCFCGDEEKDSLCRNLPDKSMRVIELRGGHHFDEDYENIARIILSHVHR